MILAHLKIPLTRTTVATTHLYNSNNNKNIFSNFITSKKFSWKKVCLKIVEKKKEREEEFWLPFEWCLLHQIICLFVFLSVDSVKPLHSGRSETIKEKGHNLIIKKNDTPFLHHYERNCQSFWFLLLFLFV